MMPFSPIPYLSQNPGFAAFMSMIPFLVLIDIILKGLALWRAGRANQPYWFVALLIVNSVGILPLIYLLAFDPMRQETKGKKSK